MNIKEAKNQIKNTAIAYLSKNEYGEYRIPLSRQRPVFLMGAPGIGKTAIMEQISQELNIAFLSYSMTHHTRQSALGLPWLSEKQYGSKTCRVSEYSMSEIIASVYEKMETTGLNEGILFLDEINCVSETLAPAILQFLQYKTFGQHRIPEGWIVTAAGNPPEFNNSVREFDAVTFDRLKVITAVPDYQIWREYAAAANIHSSIISYLDLKNDDFYFVKTTIDGQQIVTPRAWEDLSIMMRVSEKLGLPVDKLLVGQYIQNLRIAKDFSIYYELYNKYKHEYSIENILNGNWDSQLEKKAKSAPFDERISLIEILLDHISSEIRSSNQKQAVFQTLTSVFSDIRTNLEAGQCSGSQTEDAHNDLIKHLEQAHANVLSDFQTQQAKGLLSDSRKELKRKVLEKLETYIVRLKQSCNANADFSALKSLFEKDTACFKEQARLIRSRLEQLFTFAETMYGEENEILMIVSSLTGDHDCIAFIHQFGCEKYNKYNKKLLFFERQQEIENKLQKGE
ncbi:MAG: AAA family ATPase [Eubacterium sp.]|nr:AAA family ATPase [Eubacterium sp.]